LQLVLKNTLETIGIGKDFLSRTPAAQQLRERMHKWDYMKLNCFCNKRNGLKTERDDSQSGRKYLLAIHIHQRTDNQNIQKAQKPKLPQN
jgi:hypothetical protein